MSTNVLQRLEGPYRGPPLDISLIKGWFPMDRVREVTTNLCIINKRPSRSQSHQRKVRRERGW